MRSTLFVAALVGLTAAPTVAWAQEWVRCANEGQQCHFAGIKMVRYGASNQFRFGTFTDGVTCSNATFGDPIAGRPKTCWTYQTPGEVDEERSVQEMRQRLERHQVELRRRDDEIAALEIEAEAREERISELEATVDELQGRRDELRDRRDELQGRQDELRDRRDELQDRLRNR